jgi:signal transduction histidine kinase
LPSTAAYGAIVQRMPHAVVLFDEDLRVVVGNRAAALLFRIAPRRLVGVPITALLSQNYLNLLSHADGDRATSLIETSLPSRAGSTMMLKVKAVRLPLRSRDTGECGLFTLLVLEDISERVLLEQQLVDTEKQVAMGQLAAGILHEVANPINGIGSNLLFARTALPPSTPDAVKQALDATLEQLDQMRQLLGTLSGFPRRPALSYERADLHDVIRRSLTFITKEAERRRIAIVTRFSPSVGMCDLDVRVIKQVMLNLLKNAMEAMPDGGRIDVRTWSRTANATEPAAAVVEVIDSGIGIAEADLRKVFRPLFSTKPRGAGLGLSICRQAVEEHGGEIRLTSRGRGHGARAIVSLPIEQTATDIP